MLPPPLGQGTKKAYHGQSIFTVCIHSMSAFVSHNAAEPLAALDGGCSVYIYTDGACSGNPGPGGWGVLIQIDQKNIELSGAVSPTTNNRMEMLAVIKALQWRSEHCPKAKTTIVSDSQYVIRGITEWIQGWIRNGWKTSGKKPVENQDLWQEMWALVQSDSLIQWQWVRGHNQHPENEHADRLARSAIHTLSDPSNARNPRDASPSLFASHVS